LCRKDGLPAKFGSEELGSEAFGYSDDPNQNNRDRDLASSKVTLPNGDTVATTEELTTKMRQRRINLVDGAGRMLSNGWCEPSYLEPHYLARRPKLLIVKAAGRDRGKCHLGGPTTFSVKTLVL
jgi:hypothetical protein